MAVPPWPPHVMANPSKTCWPACVRRGASRWKMSSSIFRARTRWALSCSVCSTSHSVQIKKLFKSNCDTLQSWKVVLQQAVWERWLLSSYSDILSTSHSLFCFSETYLKCLKLMMLFFFFLKSLLILVTVSPTTTALIGGPGLLGTERSAGLSRAQGDVCVSLLCHFFISYFFLS